MRVHLTHEDLESLDVLRRPNSRPVWISDRMHAQQYTLLADEQCPGCGAGEEEDGDEWGRGWVRVDPPEVSGMLEAVAVCFCCHKCGSEWNIVYAPSSVNMFLDDSASEVKPT